MVIRQRRLESAIFSPHPYSLIFCLLVSYWLVSLILLHWDWLINHETASVSVKDYQSQKRGRDLSENGWERKISQSGQKTWLPPSAQQTVCGNEVSVILLASQII